MSEPVFKLQLVYPDGTALTFEAGTRFERDLVESIKTAIMERGVGFWRTEAHVEKDVVEGIRAAILDLKRETLR